MTKSELREVTKLTDYMALRHTHPHVIGMAARGFSGLIRSTRTTVNRNQLICLAAGWPCVVQHEDFII